LFVRSWYSHIDAQWEELSSARFLRRLASFSRLLLFDKRGTGASDPASTSTFPTIDQQIDDVLAVMDDTGSVQAAVLGEQAGGAMAVQFAANHPDRVSALVLCNTGARGSRAPDYPFGVVDELGRSPENLGAQWASAGEYFLEEIAPSVAHDEGFQRWWARYRRLSASPAAAASGWKLYRDLDVRSFLSAIHVPTLVLHRRENRWVPIGHGRYLAEHIPGARLIELPGADHLTHTGDQDALLDEIENFLTGESHVVQSERILATVLFTDIVGSTPHAAELGDRRWLAALDQYDTMVQRQLERYRGKAVKSTGDGTLAIFDLPTRAIQCTLAIIAAVQGLGLQIRAGLHSGEIEPRGDDVSGLAVIVAQRISTAAAPGEVLCSSTIKDLTAGSPARFEERGMHTLKGIAGSFALFAAMQP
jgi:pimeloyl-ACP methyl ester carboxylesterase